MREVTRNMIKIYCLNKLKYDFMGYTFENTRELSFHHLIVPKKDCKHMERKGFEIWNGAILKQDNAHEYLHKIECYDRERFEAISKQMIEENRQEYLDMEHLRAIDDILRSFEREYLGKRAKNGNEIIKEEYLRRLLLK